ncbi:tetratricopeptide repeat protein [Haliscomenobacter hydrossis]|uniref:Sel1 domain protein repeat-containing protein n=1 Tax=Haliscomenobacter hydrossis (strain ATCC 27775 / DSM 1100 / LMG 10767 / O) TaxID=760192 RepID=F4L0N3_HALH1|nr:tetratricopeptide repeat protein [Haliscomenobacter hydrossis]AEE49515.1 Sel1 domain protein repeat-containing protein [Haliscomenobacter hydrossis DSM 1100]
MENKQYASPMNFIDKLTLYQAANTSNAAIKKNFLVRIAEFELIIADLRSKKSKDPLQHELILGRRGSGKSTLLKRIQAEIEEDPDLKARYWAINLAEEQAGIYRLSDLWFEVLKELRYLSNTSNTLRDFDTFDSDTAYTRYLYAEIHHLLAEKGYKVVLLLDNLDRILENFNEDAHLFREFLINYNDLQIIGGSTRMDEHFWRYDKPFYDFFRIHRLEGLTFEEINHLLNHWSAVMELPELKDYALRHRGKIEAIRIFTNGLPRALQFFIEILLHDSTLYGFDYLKKIMDKATPLYQERLNNLTGQQRKIVLEMAFHYEACPTKVLVEKCRMEGKTIAAILNKLQEFGIVETLKTGNKNNLYRIAERFFNMWLIVTQGNPNQKRRARYLTHFVEAWYDPKELRDLAMAHIEDLKSGKIPYDKAFVLTKALTQSQFIGTTLRDELIDYTTKLDERNINNLELPRKFDEISKEISDFMSIKDYKSALEKLDEIENEEDGIKFWAKGLCYSGQNDYKNAEKHYRLAIEKGQFNASYSLANLYNRQSKTDLAEKHYLLAIEKGNVDSLTNLAVLYHEQDKTDLAEKYFLLAFENGYVDALYNLAILYHGRGKTDLAEKYYRLAIEKGDGDALFNLAVLYSEQSKTDLAEKHYLLAIEKGDINALNNLAYLYWETNQKKKKALQLIQQHAEKVDRALGNVLILEIWNGMFENVTEKTDGIFEKSQYEGLIDFIEALLWLGQTHLVLSFFESETHGDALRTRYELLYYATLILADKTEGNLLIKIPPETLPTVEDIVQKVKEKRAFYGVV